MKQLIADTRKQAKEYGVTILTPKEDKVYAEGELSGLNGYFDSANKILAVATGKPKKDWDKVFIHESCHFDQWLADVYLWNKWNVGYSLFFEWLDSKVELNRKQLLAAWKDVIDCELDCEKRSIAKIKKYKIPIDTKLYTQMANSYLYSYTKLLEVRTWKAGVYLNYDLLQYSPKVFPKSHLKIPPKLNKALDEFYSTK